MLKVGDNVDGRGECESRVVIVRQRPCKSLKDYVELLRGEEGGGVGRRTKAKRCNGRDKEGESVGVGSRTKQRDVTEKNITEIKEEEEQ